MLLPGGGSSHRCGLGRLWGARQSVGAWAAAGARVKAAPPVRTIDEWDPIELGVHRVIRVADRGQAGGELPVLPPYAERDTTLSCGRVCGPAAGTN